MLNTYLEKFMENSDRKKELFTNAMSNLMKDKLGVSIDLLNELINTDSEDKLAFLARGSVYLKMKNTKNAIASWRCNVDCGTKI